MIKIKLNVLTFMQQKAKENQKTNISSKRNTHIF
jgi:hypothetical protein